MTKDKKITYNEKTVADKRGDFISLDVTGNKTESIDVFKEDLVAGEKITHEFNIELRPKAYRRFFWFFVIMTFGVYYIIVKLFKCCRPKRISASRAKLALTTKGRIGLWVADTNGIQSENCCCCIRGNRNFCSKTSVRWFHVNDLCHMQHVHYIRSWFHYLFCRPVQWTSCLRLFFGVFPDQALVDAYNTSLALPKNVAMDTGLNPQQIASYFSVKSYFLAIWDQISHFTRQGFAFLGISTIDESIMVDITTRRRDNLHGDKNIALFELFEIQKAILAAKRVSAVTGIARNDSKVMLMESPEELVKKNLVQVDSTTVPLMPNEFVQEATHYDIQWRLSEIFFTIFTFGLYYFFVARFRHGLRSALVITNFRLLEISKYKPNQCCMPGENFTYAIRSWFLNGIDAGIVCREPTRVWGAVQLRYGCLYIQPTIKRNLVFTFLGLRKDGVAEAVRFLKLFSQVDHPKVFNGKNPPQLPLIMTDAYQMNKNEEFVGYLESDGVRFGGISCCGNEPPMCISSLCSFGKYPIYVHQELAMTSSRILSRAFAENRPWCLSCCCQPQYEFLFFAPLASRYFIGVQTKGQVDVYESLFRRFLVCCGIKAAPATAYSALSLSFAYNSHRKGFPITILSRQRFAEEGLLENPNLLQMRTILAHLHAAKSERGADPYFAAVPSPTAGEKTVQQHYTMPVMQYVPIDLPTAPSYDPNYVRRGHGLQYPAVVASSKISPVQRKY